jgi:glycosyltransferase involved in cell wall biosynthesis
VDGRELTVGIDVSPLALTRAGTATHIRGLTAALARLDGLELRPYAFGGPSRLTAALRDVAWYLGALPLAARRDRVDVLHCPTFRAPPRCPVPLVVTVHDLAVLRHPHLFNRWSREYGGLLLPHVLRAATAVIAVSKFTRAEVLELADVPEERVHVVGNGVGDPFTPDGRAGDGDYVLAVATLEPRKNLPRLVDGFRRARLDGAELRVAGASGWGGVAVAGTRVRWLGEVGTEELARLYRGALCVAYVSLYEGFGLPVLEAMACGSPVVISQAPALREVAGEAAIAVDALDPDAIAAGLEEAIARRDELVGPGLARAAQFSWADAARRTLAVYRSAAS